MKVTYLCVGLLAAGLVAFTGCKKSGKTLTTTTVDGVQLDTAKFAQVFEGASPELHQAQLQIQLNIRYSQYVQALEGLDKLSNDPSLNEEQKKAVAELVGQVKQLAAKTQGAQ